MKVLEWIKGLDKMKSILFLSKAGVAFIAILTIVLMYDQVRVMREQSEILIIQNRSTTEEFKNNLYFQKLNRRTYLLSILYDLKVHNRIRKEALYEYLRLDKEVKEIEFNNQESDTKKLHREMFSINRKFDWERFVIANPERRTDLTGIILRDMNLEFVDLSNTILNEADFSCSELSSASLRRAELKNAKFVWSNLGGAHLESATATSADFSGSRLNGSFFTSTWLEDAKFDMSFIWKTNFGQFRSNPGSAKWALILEPYDIDGSGGAKEFESWALSAGAKAGMSYDEWQQKLLNVIEQNRITKPSSRPQKAPLVPRSAFCGG